MLSLRMSKTKKKIDCSLSSPIHSSKTSLQKVIESGMVDLSIYRKTRRVKIIRTIKDYAIPSELDVILNITR